MGGFFSFRGRATRSQWWKWVGIYFLSLYVTGVSLGLFIENIPDDSLIASIVFVGAMCAWWLMLIMLTVKWYAMSVRRLHDMNHSGWYILLTFVPLVNLIVLPWLGISRSYRYDNKHGAGSSGAPPVTP